MTATFVNPISHEITQEKASGLSRTEKRFVAALEAYRRQAQEADRQKAVFWELVDATTAFVVHREACGLRDPWYVFDLYGVPAEAVAHIGVRRKSASR